MRRLRWGLWMFLLAAGTLRVIGAGYLPATRALVGDFAAVFPTRALATWLRPDFPTEQVWQGWFYGPMLHVLTLPLFLVPRWSLVPAVWATVNLAALVISFFLVLKLSGHTRRSLFTTGLLAGLWMLYQPLVNCLAQGNIEILELLLVLWALTSLERRRGALSGVLLGIAAMTKFLPIGFLGWLLVRRQWRATLYGATTVAAIAIATAFTLGWAASGSRQDMSWAVDAPIAGPQELSITSMFVHRSALLLGPADDSIPASFTVWASAARAEAASQTGAVVSLLLAVAIGVTIIRRRHQPSTPSELAVLFMTMFMILPWNHDYYYIFALVPFTLLLQDAVARRDRVLLTMTLAGYLLISPPIPFSWIDQSALMKIRFSDLYGFVDAPTIGGVILWVAAVHRMLSETTSGIVSTWFSARRIVMLAAIVLLAVAAFATATVRLRTPAAQAVSETRAIDPPIHVAGNAALALSADGAYLAYVALQQDQPTLCVRRMDSGATTCHAETRGASVPFFSPDSRWIGFVVGAELRKIAVTGEPGMTTIAPSLGAHNAEWEPDGTILLATPANGLLRVTANDGRTEVVLPPATDASALTGPTLLPSGHTVLVSQPPSGGSVGVGTITAWSLSTGRRTRLFAGTAPHFDSHSGRLMYVVGGRLMSVKFDPTRLVWTGPSFPVSGSVLVTASGGPLVGYGGNVIVSVPGESAPRATRELVWVDRNGTPSPLPLAADAFETPRLSPDGRTIAAGVRGVVTDVVSVDVATGERLRVTSTAPTNETPIWTPDGRIAFRAPLVSAPGSALLVVPRDGNNGDARRAWDGAGRIQLGTWSSDGQRIVGTASGDLWSLERKAPDQPSGSSLPRDRWSERITRTTPVERGAVLSPDGRLLAYSTTASGQSEIWVQPVTDADARHEMHKVSRSGGREPVWSRDGRELFFRSDDALLAVSVTGTSTGEPRVLFRGSYYAGQDLTQYDVAPDGRRFLMLRETADGHGGARTFVMSRAPAAQRAP